MISLSRLVNFDMDRGFKGHPEGFTSANGFWHNEDLGTSLLLGRTFSRGKELKRE